MINEADYENYEWDTQVVPDEEALLLSSYIKGEITLEEYDRGIARLQEELEEKLRRAGALAE